MSYSLAQFGRDHVILERQRIAERWRSEADLSHVGRGGPLVLGGGRARAAFGPAPGDLVLLPDPGLIGEPDLERLAADRLPDLLQTGREVFFKAATAASF